MNGNWHTSFDGRLGVVVNVDVVVDVVVVVVDVVAVVVMMVLVESVVMLVTSSELYAVVVGVVVTFCSAVSAF